MAKDKACPRCGASKTRRHSDPKAARQPPKSLAAKVRKRLAQAVPVYEDGRRKRVRYERLVEQVQYVLKPGYWPDPLVPGGFVKRPTD